MDKAKIYALCGSVAGYQQFRIEWTVMCYLLNPNIRNKKRLKSVMATKDDDLVEYEDS